MLVAFYYIRMRMPHLRIRGLRDIFSKKEAWLQAEKALNVEAELTQKERDDLGLSEVTEPEEEEDFEPYEETGQFTTTVEERDLQEEAIWRKRRQDKLKSIYEDAKEQEQIVKDSERPLALAKRALKNISAIPKKQSKLKEPEIDNILAKIIKETNALRKIIKKQTTGTKRQRKISKKKKKT
ncbi:hypothetical protein ES703_89491 [subsurface metagenome]